MSEILVAGPGRDRGWSPAYHPSSECDLGDIGANPIVAYRMWQVRWHRCAGGEVKPALCGVHPLCAAEWREREARAHCLSRPIAGRAGDPKLFVAHDTPAPECRCTCGLSAFYEPSEQMGVCGVVALGGHAILHDTWLRAERARIECFAMPARSAAADREFIERLAEAWRVPTVEASQLRSFGRGAGREVPALLRPRKASGAGEG